MDKEQARFILQSFRPDGADAKDPDFAEALQVAAEDRELGDWLAAERAQDAAFAAALNDLAIPDELRRNILSVLKMEEGEAADFEKMDSSFIGALASVSPPEGLRDQILTAMTVETASEPVEQIAPEVVEFTSQEEVKDAPKRVQGWLKTAAIAAALVLGAFVAFELTPNSGSNPVSPDERITLKTLEYGAIAQVSGEINLDLQSEDLDAQRNYMGDHNAPVFKKSELPKGLAKGKGKPVGCRLFKIDNTKVSLVCFDKAGQTVHLVVLKSSDLRSGDLAKLKKAGDRCWQCPNTEVAVASWKGTDKTYLLLGKMEEKELLEYF